MNQENALIYFIQVAANGPVKIGHTENLSVRMSTLQSCCPYKLGLLGTINGTAYVERHYHRYFAEERLGGEWFTPSERLMAQIHLVTTNALAAGVYPGEPIPEPVQEKPRRKRRKVGFSCPSHLRRFLQPYEGPLPS